MIIHDVGEIAPKELRLDIALGAPRSAVWRCWTESELLKQWYCPKPWSVESVDMDVKPGGRFNSVFAGPNGERFENVGCFLAIDAGERLVFTDGYREGWVPAEKHFMTGNVELSDAPDGSTRMIWGARHANDDDTKKHLEMGFAAGWTAAAAQLEELAKSLTGEAAPGLRKKLRTCLWFEKGGLAAAEHYVSLLPDSFIEATFQNGAPVEPMIIEFTLAGAPFMILNGGPRYKLNPAASISVLTKSQGETDALWAALLKDGGEESRCGWLVDQYDVSWQIVPEALPRLANTGETAARARVVAAMMKMTKIDIAALGRAHQG